ncbi:MAG TPA: acetate/propionate family kinase [Terracidiphilus sp.]|nr:acetate/propionate family kinase [Terracidiphilus sp.]
MEILVFNPGSNSLKAGIVMCRPEQRSASAGEKLVEVIAEGIGKDGKLSVYRGKSIEHSEPLAAHDFKEAAAGILGWLAKSGSSQKPGWDLDRIDAIGIRVVHGGDRFTGPARLTEEVERAIADFAKWAPLHNRRSLEILEPIRDRFSGLPLFAVFDTAFHRTIPPRAAFYAIPYELSEKHRIRRYGFHGISHRYLMERYGEIVGQPAEELKLVTMHLESGCSVTAIAHGRSVDNTMGLTPLEGLMMGTRSGDLDPALIPFLVRAEHIEVDEVMVLLEKKSGLLGVSGKSLDTRVLMGDYDSDQRVRLAMEMFSYRVLKAVGAYVCALAGADAVIFGGGIAENTKLFRKRVCEGLRWCGLAMDAEQNERLVDVEGRLSTSDSRIQAYVIPVEETLQIAHECCETMSR